MEQPRVGQRKPPLSPLSSILFPMAPLDLMPKLIEGNKKLFAAQQAAEHPIGFHLLASLNSRGRSWELEGTRKAGAKATCIL